MRIHVPLLITVLFATGGCAQAEPGKSDAAQDDGEAAPGSTFDPGLAVGQQAPAFRLLDQSGTEQSLAGILEDGPVALVFYRSADW